MDTTSLWHAISKRPFDYPELKSDIEVDVVIIGGGITGVTAAQQLIASGKTVAILEACKIGGVTTGSSTGNLYIAVQPFYQHIYSKFNLETVKTVAHARKMAIDFIEANVREKNMECHFHRRPWYGFTNDDPRISLEKEVELLKKVDIAIEYTQSMPLPFKFKKAAVMLNQGRVNPLQYVISLAGELAKKGCQIYEETRALSYDEKKDICTVKTKHGQVIAKKILLATHTPIGFNPTQMFIAPYRSHVVSMHMRDNIYPEGHFWDLDKKGGVTCTHPIHSNHPELVMVSGVHHKTGQGTPDHLHFDGLRRYLETHLPVTEVAYQWSAQHYQSADNVPYIGLATRFAKHTYLATGYFSDGLIYGTIAGMVIGDTILEKSNPLIHTFKANRFKPFASIGFLTKENLNVFAQYVKDYLRPRPTNYDDIKKGEGKVVKINHEKCAVSRDENGELHIVSAVCTHMGCIVHWNDAEQTWDCPCHGSRFTCAGKVIEGPAIKNLEKKPASH